jgi:hypothetical protein
VAAWKIGARIVSIAWYRNQRLRGSFPDDRTRALIQKTILASLSRAKTRLVQVKIVAEAAS